MNFSTSDITAPTLVSYELSSYEIDLSQGDYVIDVRARITDDISGVPMVNTQAGFFVAHHKHAGEVQVVISFSTLDISLNQAQGLIWMEFICQTILNKIQKQAHGNLSTYGYMMSQVILINYRKMI